MISDTLLEARREIQRYLNDPIMGKCYDETTRKALDQLDAHIVTVLQSPSFRPIAPNH